MSDKISEKIISDLKTQIQAQRIMCDLYDKTQGETSVDELVAAVATAMQSDTPDMMWVYEEAKLFFE